MTPELNGSIRNILAALGGVGVTLGWFDALQLDQALNAIMQLLGAGAVIGAIAWTIWSKHAASKEAQDVTKNVLASGGPTVTPK